MIKYLRCENLSSKNYKVKIARHPVSATEALIDYIKRVVKTNFLSDSYWNKWFNEWCQQYDGNTKTCWMCMRCRQRQKD